MVLLALLAATAAQPADARPRAVVQATATVRIISASRLTLGSGTPGAELRTARVRDRDGLQKPAKLIEFQ
jgi:hypothetical protein